MKHLLSKDLGIIFLLNTIYVLVVSFPNFHYSNHLSMIFFVASFLFSGYTLVALLRPEENYKDLLKKPVLILEFSVLITLIISVLFKFTYLGLHLKNLVLVLSVIIMILAISAYIRRINYFKAHEFKENSSPEKMLDVSSEQVVQEVQLDENVLHSKRQAKKSMPKTESSTPKRRNYLDLILIAFLSVFVIISYLIKPLNNYTFHYYLGFIYMLFLTGYPVTYIIFPIENELKLKIRLLLSVGISFPVTSIIGLPLYYSKYSFTAVSALLPLAVLTLVLIVFAYLRKANADNE